jgi:hypothetical protein
MTRVSTRPFSVSRRNRSRSIMAAIADCFMPIFSFERNYR